jgi:hypothetical protein
MKNTTTKKQVSAKAAALAAASKKMADAINMKELTATLFSVPQFMADLQPLFERKQSEFARVAVEQAYAEAEAATKQQVAAKPVKNSAKDKAEELRLETEAFLLDFVARCNSTLEVLGSPDPVPEYAGTWQTCFCHIMRAYLDPTPKQQHEAMEAARSFLHFPGQRGWCAQFVATFREVSSEPEKVEAAIQAANFGQYGDIQACSPRAYFGLDKHNGSGLKTPSSKRKGKSNRTKR